MENYHTLKLSSETQVEQSDTKESPEALKPYRLYHTNVDGGGFINRFETFDQAKKEAQRLQEESDTNGNYWYYRYHVYGPGMEEYHTFYDDALLQAARREHSGDY